LNGSVVMIESLDIKKKKDAARMIIDFLSETTRTEEEKGKEHDEDVLILVPNGLVSIIIGSRGKHIKYLIGDSKANIVVNQPVYRMLHRTITITGKS